MTNALSALTRVSATVFLVSLVAGCDQPVGPTRTIAPLPPPSPQSVRIHGAVIDGANQPVAGAHVTARADGESRADTLTDTKGAYALEVQTDVNEIVAEREGFEPSRVFAMTIGDPLLGQDVRLHRIWRITAGESAGLLFTWEDPVCDDALDSWLCRRVRVVSPVGGVLQLGVHVPYDEPPFLVRLPGRADVSTRGPQVSLSVTAGSETVVEVLLVGGSPPLATTLSTVVERQ